MDQLFEVLGKIGGIGAIGFAIYKLGINSLGKFWEQKQKGEIDKEVENHRQFLESSRSKTDKYFESQFNVYERIWKKLQLLNISGDALWAKANDENISRFSQQLRETKEIVREEAIFFDDADYRNLTELLEKFSEYGEGKIRLINIRSREEIEDDDFLKRKIREQIVENWDQKEKYENILESIRASFRNRLSSFEKQNAT